MEQATRHQRKTKQQRRWSHCDYSGLHGDTSWITCDSTAKIPFDTKNKNKNKNPTDMS